MDLLSRLASFAIVAALTGLFSTQLEAASPTLTSMSVVPGSIEDSDSIITAAALRIAGDEFDADGGTINFRIKAITNGSLDSPVNTVISNSNPVIWTPPANANGNIAAFTVVAFDGTNESATPVTVTISVAPVNDPPSFTAGSAVSRIEDVGSVTINNWASNISPGPPNESAQSVEFILTNNNSALFSTQPAISPQGHLTFTPQQDENGVALLTVKIRDNGGGSNESPTQNFSITISPVNDPPEITTPVGGIQTSPYPDSLVGTDGAPPTIQAPFNTVTINDVDHLKDYVNPLNEPLNVKLTISRDIDAYGEITTPPSGAPAPTITSTHYIYNIPANSPATVQSALRATRFRPFANAQPVGIYNFNVKIEATDPDSVNATPLVEDLEVASINDTPIPSVTITPSSIPDSTSVKPFRLSIVDPDVNETFSVTITETTPVPLGTIDLTSITGNAAQINQAVQNITYTPLPQTIASQVATFSFSITDIHPGGATGTPVIQSRNLTVTFTNGIPEITGVPSEVIRTTDDPSAPVVTPFPNVSITDSNTSQILTVTLSLDDPAKGTFSGLISNQLTGTAASVTNALRNVVFTPTPNRLAVNQQETAIVTITVFDGLTTRTDSTTEIVITYVNGAPVIDYQIPNGPFPSNSSPALISPNLTTNPPSSLPFHDVLISDEGDVVVTITIDDAAKGTFESPGDRFAPISAGVVRFTGSHTDAQDAIQELKFITNPAYQFPAGQPGRTNFTILATDSVLNQTTRILPIVLISNARNFLVTNTLDTTIVSGSTGTPGSLRHAILNAAPNDVITFALPSYPATIRLNKSNGPLVINKHLSFKGPGADKLTISGDSNSNGNTDSNDVRIFTIYSAVSIEGIRLSRGFDANGGAIFVGRAQPGVPAGSLYLANSTISNSIASNWGGAIDVFDGSIRVENCLFSNNSVSVAAGLGGGAVSLFTHSPCSFLNTTFSANEQRSPNGYGGGAIYVENDTPVAIFQTTVTHCTFAANTDARNRGSSIHSNVSNTRVLVANSVFADFSARNLYVTGGGDILSQGGNLSNDNTTTEYIIGGNPLLFKLLNHGSDIVNTDPQLNTLANVGGETLAHSPKPSSPAIGLGLPNLATTDQRGTVRVTGSPTLPENTDAGAIEFSGNGKIIVHEIAALPASSSDFIEFFNPRNQQEINLTNHEIWIDDVKIRTLTAPLVIQPGFGFVLSNNTVTTPNASTPVILVNPSTPSAPLSLRPRGKIEIRKPGNGAPILNTSYVAVFANKDIPANTDLIYDSDSITLAPQFGGNALVPHRLVQPPPSGSLLGATGDSTSPGADTGNTPLGEPNAYPIAILDRFEVTEDEIANLNVLTNDLDADGSDSLFIIDVNPLENPAIPTTNATALSVAGAPVSIIPNSPAQRGKSIEFNPVTPFNHLPAGARVTDFFAYSIIDVGRGPIASFASGGGAFTLVSSPAHRLANGETITITDSSHAPFNGTYPVSSVTPNSFLIPVTFVSGTNGGLNAFWQADTPRSPTLRDTAMVEVTVLGRNDPPVPAPNSVATQEDTILRILGDATRVGTSPAFDTDANYPLPRQLSSVGIIANDTDPDDGDMPYTNLKLIGVCNALPISSYAPQTTTNLVTVTATDHGLANNTRILISGYGGHPSYNGYHFITLIDEHTFSIPVTYIDNHPTKGLWTLLNDESRLVTTTEMGATATLEIRADRSLTNIVYNPRTSPAIDALAINQPATDRFFYAIEDPQGAVSIAEITVNLTGTNDTTVPGNDPAGLLTLNPSLQPGTNLAQYIADAQIIGIRPAPSSDARNVAILAPGADPSGSQLINSLRQTDEDTAIAFTATSLLANDTDIDLIDSLTIEVAPGQTSSRMGAQISLAPGATAVNYNPANASQLQSLARGEPVIDTFSITIFDGTTRVTSLVAVLVIGVNDSPIAVADSATTTEKSLLQLNSPAIIGNDVEIDQNNSLPDDRKFLLPTGNTSTTVFGAIANANFERRDGEISSFTASGSNPAVTLVNSSAHNINTGENIVITGAGVLTGQFTATAIDANTFSIPVPHDPSFSTLAGSWSVLTSRFSYDPRPSISTLNPADFTFTLQGLALGQTYVDTIPYTVLDGSFLFANNDIYRIEADRSLIELDVLLNDTNLEGLSTGRKIIAVSPTSSGGTVTIQDGQSLLYTPETGFVGDEFFTYTIEDSLGQQATANVITRVTVNRLNGNIQANDDTFTVAAGQSPLLNTLANDDAIPTTGSPLTLIAIASLPDQGGQATIENGQIRYTPDPLAVTFPYTETFSYQVSGGGSAIAEANVSVLVVNRANTLNLRSDTFTIQSNSIDSPLLVLANDNILPGNGAALVITDKGSPNFGTTSLSGNTLTYTPNPGFLGTDTFTYSASDNLGGTGTATISVTVGYLITNNDFFAVLFDNPSSSTDDGTTQLDVLANDSVANIDPGSITITAVSPANPTLGSISITPGGKSLTFDPATNQTGLQTFTYTITDSSGRTASNTVTITIVSQGVRANSDAFTIQTDSSENILPVLANDLRISQTPGTLAIASIGTGPNAPDQGGTVQISEDLSSLIYQPVPGFNGTETFTYTISDGDNNDTARVTLRVTNGELIAAADSFFTYRGSSDNSFDVLANDRVLPENGDILTITATDLDLGNPNPPHRGSIAITPGGDRLIYTPSPANTSYPYIETFTYEISDGGPRRSVAQLRIEVIDRIGARDLDTNNDAFTVRADSIATAFNVLANDNIRPATAAAWTITSITAPTANVASPILPGAIANPSTLRTKLITQADPVSLYIWSTLSPSAQAILNNPAASEISHVNTIIAALNAIATGPALYDPTRFASVSLRQQTSDLLAENPVGEQLIVLNRLLVEDAFPSEISPLPGGGTTLISGSSILYTPAPGFVGFERFTYRVSDGLGGTGFAEVIVRVGDISISDDFFAVVAGSGPILLDVTANDGILRDPFPSSPSPALADFTIATAPNVTVDPTAAGSAIVDGSQVSFSPDAAFHGIATLTYWVKDDSGHLFPGTAKVEVRPASEDRDSNAITVTVTGVNDAPLLLNADPSATNDKSIVRPFPDATVIEFDNQRLEPVTLRITFPPDRGVLSGAFTLISPGVLQMTGTAAQVTAALRALVFTPVQNRITVGTTENTLFSVSLTDNKIPSPVIIDSAVATVTPVNDPPTIQGTLSGQLVYKKDTLKPFAQVSITEIDDLTLQPLFVTVRINNPIHGFITGNGFTETSPGSRIYNFNGTASAATAALRQLVFEPTAENRPTPGSPESVPVTITINDGFSPNIVDTVTSILVMHAEVDRILPLNAGIDASQSAARFGQSVAISGDTLVVGANLYDSSAADTGRVDVYQRGNSASGAPWRHTATLTGTGLNAGDRFGASVAIDGDTIVVGAPQADPNNLTNSGAIYIFNRDPGNADAWIQSPRILANTPLANELFGRSVAIQGDTLLVGAPEAIVNSTPRIGRVQSFHRTAGVWSHHQTINGPFTPNILEGALTGFFFGHSLAIDGNNIIVGAYGANLAIDAFDVGAVFIYARTTSTTPWNLERRIDRFTFPDTLELDHFGFAVDIDKDTIIVGANQQNPDEIDNSGAAYVYERNAGGAGNWGMTRKLELPIARSLDYFGQSVAIAGDLIMVGAPRIADGLVPRNGLANLYRRNEGGPSNWGIIDSFAPGLPTADDRFGSAIALDGFTAAVAAIGDEVNANAATDAGSVRIYQFRHEPGASISPAAHLASAYDAWSAARFSPADLSNPALENSLWGPTADSDGDGAPNLIEMLYGTLPTSPNASPLTYQPNPDGSVTVTFPNSGLIPSELVHLEWSSNLTTWSRNDIASTVTPNAPGPDTITATITPATPQSSIFVRIYVGP